MASIYSNAYLTIIAAQGEAADYGIRGVGNGSQPRNFPQTIFELQPEQKMLMYDELGCGRSAWNTRGWTMQEKKFSSRMLVFIDNAVYWVCPCARWQEDKEMPDENPKWTAGNADLKYILTLTEQPA